MSNKENLSVAIVNEFPLSTYQETSSTQENRLNNTWSPVLQELTEEAEKLFKILDDSSASIKIVEANLQSLAANFPFRILIKKDAESLSREPEDYHKANSNLDLLGYNTQICWFLAWGSDDISKKFRLLIIAEEKEILWYRYGDDPEGANSRTFQIKEVFKKPLIESNLQMRLDYSEHLMEFIYEFKKYLQKKREKIACNNYYYMQGFDSF